MTPIQPQSRLIPVTRRCSRSAFATLQRKARSLVPLLAVLSLTLSLARATIPAGAISDPLYAKGYLVATYYSGVSNNNMWPTSTTAGLQQAIYDARDNSLVLYLPSGTYEINGTLKAYTATSIDLTSKPIMIVGSTLSTRPIIKLAPSTFTSSSSPQIMLDFKNFTDTTYSNEKPDSGYFQMLRGVDLDCTGATNAGAIGLYFNQAQDSTIENVKVTATNAVTGIWGIPARAYGAVNIEVDGGTYGIDTTPAAGTTGNANIGSCIAGLTLNGQTGSAIRHPGQALTIVGFEIVTPASSGAAITAGNGSTTAGAETGCLVLIDGKITLGSTSSFAISNPNERTIYLRNVSVTGSGNLVQSGTNTPITRTGTWRLINEYSYCNQNSTANVGRETWGLINGLASRNPAPPSGSNPGEVVDAVSSAPVPPTDFILRHTWAALPSVDDTDYYDPVGAHDISPGVVSSATLQGLLTSHRKIFLRPGTYSLTNPITLQGDSIVFGASRHLTRIEVAPPASWGSPPDTPVTAEVALITTVNDATATTYLGDVSIGVPTDNNSDGTSRDYFTALNWQAGANSMVHIGRPYHNPTGANGTFPDTTAHSLLKTTNAGGGRWYFVGCGESQSTGNSGYRMLKADTTTQPLWIYGLNMEHVRSDYFAEFVSASNIRIYGVKTENHGEFNGGTPYTDTTFFGFNGATNVALYGHAAVRHSPSVGRSVVEFKGTGSPPSASGGLLAAVVVPQSGGTGGSTLSEAYTSTYSLPSPDGLALYRRGTITATDEGKMVHANIGYTMLPSPWTGQDIGSVGLAGSAFYGSGVFTLNASGADIFGTVDAFYFVHQASSNDTTITARVATQENTNNFAKAGVMVRATLGNNVQFVNVHVTPVSGTRMHYRSTVGGTVTSITGPSVAAPCWVRLKRAGNVFTGYVSTDGTTWTTVGSVTIALSASLQYGLINCSVNNTVINTSTLDSVTLTTP